MTVDVMAGRVCNCWAEEGFILGFWQGNLTERGRLADVGKNGKMRFKFMLKKEDAVEVE